MSQKPSQPLLVPVAFSESASSSKSTTPPTPQRSTPWSPPIARFPPFTSSPTSPPVPSTAADFTHFLHSRFLSKPDLAAYTVHPSHLAVVHQNAPIIEDIFAVDWAADLDGEIVPSPGSAMRFLIAKPQEGKQAAEIVKAIDEVRVSKLSWGVNFSHGRAKGYEVVSLLEFVAIEKRIGDFVDNVIVVEVVVPFSCL
ncbi:hypothetical protein KFK09_014036 [Dendrobium nobile]|uniref:Stress-response A/B barrel domain-containing protein n=1 Tax=Dendrobium nobile TaxID=94219 RepID=A0A8T3BAQ4_DENNO|nr:hypothetical protein KFK09_014036 [Dendrobium nobile]